MKKKFAADSKAAQVGYNLPLMIGWLEDMCLSEEYAKTKKRRKQYELVCDAVDKLNQANDLDE
jgi:hypothetical protein